jgi:uncharacterized membrane protein HdeD (DUF308 family)
LGASQREPCIVLLYSDTCYYYLYGEWCLTTVHSSNSDDTNNKKSPGALRFIEVGLGAIAIILTIVTLAYPGITTKTIIRLIPIVLLIIGIERIAVGITLPLPGKSYRLVYIGLGPLIMSLAIVLISVPLSHPVSQITLGALALLFNGISKMMQGIRAKQIPGWSRCILVAVGTLNIPVSALAIIVPNFGESPLARSVSITLLITGIQMIASELGIKKKYSASHFTMS